MSRPCRRAARVPAAFARLRDPELQLVGAMTKVQQRKGRLRAGCPSSICLDTGGFEENKCEKRRATFGNDFGSSSPLHRAREQPRDAAYTLKPTAPQSFQPR